MHISDPVSSIYGTGLKHGLDFNQCLLQGAQRVRRYQMQQIDAALSECAALSNQIDGASNQDQLQALWSTLAYRPVDRIINYWNGLCSVLVQNQIELAGECRNQALDMADGFKQRLEDAPAAIPEPMAATLKMMAELARSTVGNAPPRGGNGAGRKNGDQDDNRQQRKSAAEARGAAP